MTIEELVKKIIDKPTDLKNPKKLSRVYNSSYEDCLRAIKLVKNLKKEY